MNKQLFINGRPTRTTTTNARFAARVCGARAMHETAEGVFLHGVSNVAVVDGGRVILHRRGR